MGAHARYPVRTHQRELMVGTITFATANTDPPTALDDLEAGIALSVARTAAGRFEITLADTFKRVRATANAVALATNTAQVSAHTTSPTNKIQVSVLDSSAAEADTTGVTVVVDYKIQR